MVRNALAKRDWALLAIVGLLTMALGCNDSDDEPDDQADATADAISDATSDVTADVISDAVSDVISDAVQDIAVDTSADVTVDVTLDVTADTTVDTTECQALTGDDIWNGGTLDGDICYTVSSVVQVTHGLLEIKPGARLIFARNAGLSFERDGWLQAIGTADDPITFTGEDKTRGYWKGLHFRNETSEENMLDHTVVEYAGASAWSSIRGRGGVSVSSANAHLTVRNSTFRENEIAGFAAVARDAVLTLASNHFVSNTAPLHLHPNHVGSITREQTFTGNDAQYVLVDAMTHSARFIEREQTWHALDVPYQIGPRTLHARQPQTFEPGAVLEFGEDLGLTIEGEGRLIADASGGDSIVFRGLEDTNAFWKGLMFDASFSNDNVLDNVVVENAGSSSWFGHRRDVRERSQANIYVCCRGDLGRSMLEIRNTEISGSGRHGISVEEDSIVTDCAGLAFKDNAYADTAAEDGAIVCF